LESNRPGQTGKGGPEPEENVAKLCPEGKKRTKAKYSSTREKSDGCPKKKIAGKEALSRKRGGKGEHYMRRPQEKKGDDPETEKNGAACVGKTVRRQKGALQTKRNEKKKKGAPHTPGLGSKKKKTQQEDLQKPAKEKEKRYGERREFAPTHEAEPQDILERGKKPSLGGRPDHVPTVKKSV